MIFAELKREKTGATDEQKGWLRALVQADAEVYLIRPRHLDALAHVLAARTHPEGGHLTTEAARRGRHELCEELRKEIG